MKSEEGAEWAYKGVRFPHGTEFRARYGNAEYRAEVNNGALVFEGEKYGSPSAAAYAVTKNSVNGWTFWECRLPNSTKWRRIDSLRE